MIEQQSEHEVLTMFKQLGTPLAKNLTEMLNEHFSHQTERRGCGYTQATRVMAEFINQEQEDADFKDFKLFDGYDTKNLKNIVNQAKLYQLELSSWRNLDLVENIQSFIEKLNSENHFTEALKTELAFQTRLRTIADLVQFEESKLICNFLEDIILRKSNKDFDFIEVKSLSEKPKVGSCPMAENFFLKIAHGRLLRQGRINLFVDEHNQPILMEKINMGDDHSCISLVPLIMNGIRIPQGSLFSAKYDENQVSRTANKTYKGDIIPLKDIEGFWFLRLTTLAVSPKNRARAFSSHFKQQVDNGLFSPDTTELSQLVSVAQDQI